MGHNDPRAPGRVRPHAAPSEQSVRLSSRLREYMADNGIGIDDVARRLGRSRSYVGDHTTGVRSLDLDIVNTVATLTGTDLRSLMSRLLD